jgi:subtilase family serine protease
VIRLIVRAFAFSCIAALTACSGALPGRDLAAPNSEGLGPDDGYYPLTTLSAVRAVCPPVDTPGEMRCFAWMRTDFHAQPASGKSSHKGVGYTAAQIQAAYGLDVSKGGGQTVAIVDAFGDDTAESDLATYRSAAGLPPCTIQSGCLRILNQNGQPSPLPPQPKSSSNKIGWTFEETLDLEAVSAVCPKCKIILLQAAKQNSGSLYTAVATAARLGAGVITNSYGGGEAKPVAPAAFNQPGHVIIASSGDSGGGSLYYGGPQMPCTYANVVCVGGTRLTHKHGKWHEVVWNDLATSACGGSCGATGSGCSNLVPKPGWQTDSGCKLRSETDIAATASPLAPFAIYSALFKSLYGSGWQPFGGTSLSAPLIAGMFALAGNASSRHGAQEIWQNHSALKDIVKGNNIDTPLTGPCASSVTYICVAGSGYDGPTGWGTPNGIGAY